GKYCMVVVMTLVLEQQHYREGEKVVMGKEPVVELEYDKVVEKLVLVHMEKAAFLSALVGSEVAYSAAQATVATLSEAYETTKNHRSFPKTHHYKVRMANIFGLRLRASESIKIMVIMEYNAGFVFDAEAGSGNSWLQHDFNSTNIYGINEYRQGPLYSVFPTKLAQVSSVQDLFEFICSGPLLEKIGVTAEMVAEYIDKWLLYGRLLSQLFQLNEIYQYYISVFLWCEDQIKQHRSTFKNEEDVPHLVIGFSAPQGCGKTILVFALNYLFQKTGRFALNFEAIKSATISIYNFYLTAEGQAKLREANPGNSLLEVVIHMICRRSAFNGRGDRADPSTWPEVEGPLTVVLFEGWMLGFKPLSKEVVKAVDLQFSMGGKLTSESIKFFSPIVIWTKFNSSPENYEILYSAFKDYYKEWLELISQNLEAQHRYLVWRAEKDLLRGFLFNGVDVLGSKTFNDYFPHYCSKDGDLNNKGSIIGKSFENRPWDERGEFL
ncbi:hypothetical protein S83_004087, partial [Arachis hypogaea]